MLCPVCNVDLAISERQEIEIDYCPKCRGIWLDRGELDKMLERNADYDRRPDSLDSKPLRDDDYYKRHPGEYKRKRKSFFDDLFDF